MRISILKREQFDFKMPFCCLSTSSNQGDDFIKRSYKNYTIVIFNIYPLLFLVGVEIVRKFCFIQVRIKFAVFDVVFRTACDQVVFQFVCGTAFVLFMPLFFPIFFTKNSLIIFLLHTQLLIIIVGNENLYRR